MTHTSKIHAFSIAGALLLAATMTACGGGASSVQPNTPATPPSAPAVTVSSVSVSCSPSMLAGGATAKCAATVQGTGAFSSAVTWSSSSGAIDASGVLTAPLTAGIATVTATSTQDSTVKGVADVTVEPAPPTITSVAAFCNPASIIAGATSQCTAAVQGTGVFSTAVTWSASSGSISAGGLFTAPASAGQVSVTATSSLDPGKQGTASVTVQAAPSVPPVPPAITSVAASCTPTTLNTGATSQCTAMLQGTGAYNPAVSWSASTGSIDASGLFTAPSSSGPVNVTAVSVEDATRSATVPLTVQLATPASRHVVMVMEENTGYTSVVHNSAWPNLNNLIDSGGLPADYYSDSHPSIGNYFMLTTGSLLTTSDSSTTVWNVDSIARRLLAAGVPFKVYAEGITQGYLGGNTGLYLLRHNPFAMLSDVADNPQVANRVICPFSQFAVDLAAGNLPAFSFIVPDVDDDAHNGSPQQADSWLQNKIVVPLSGSPAFQPAGDGLLIVDFDEAADSDTAHGGGHVSPVFWGPNVKVGYLQTSTTVYQHESMLRTVMEALQLPSPPAAAATAPSLAEFFVQK